MTHTLYKLPDLAFGFAELVPHIDAKTMEIHHDRHHNGYITNLNAALEKEPSVADISLEDMLKDLSKVPDSIRTAVRNNGGGHFNHSLFWKILTPEPTETHGKLKKAIERDFGSVDAFQEQFSKAAATRFGSGWAWLSADGSGKLVVHSTPNQDTPLSDGLRPVIGLDVWEHAYYLNYQNRRADYIKAFWNILDWHAAETFYTTGFGV
ncbi:MAG: superoxide dismutase [Spirochaetales bacterium]|nr:superoxide dismutase [Spirochaetales bacterium]